VLSRHGNTVRIDEAIDLGVYDANHSPSTGFDLGNTEVVLIGDPKVTVVVKCNCGWVFE
jgi:hypothetical protein